MNAVSAFDFKTAFVTGAAGFIGSNLVDRLLAAGVQVVGIDNMSTGMPEFLIEARRHAGFTFVNGDLLDAALVTERMSGADIVFHFAANADIRFGLEHPRKDLEQNTIVTFNVWGPRIIARSTIPPAGSPVGSASRRQSPIPAATAVGSATILSFSWIPAASARSAGGRSSPLKKGCCARSTGWCRTGGLWKDGGMEKTKTYD
jgi:UDP-glucose 4-epimerase